MADGIGPRPAFDWENGVSFCRNGMQIGVALPSAGTIHLVVEIGGSPLFEGDLTVDLPYELGPLTHDNGDTYEYYVVDYFQIPWSRTLSLPTTATMRFGPNQEWFKTIQIGTCLMKPSTPMAEIVQVGPGSTSPSVVGSLVFEATARDDAVGSNNGAGLYAVVMQVEDAGGSVVHRAVLNFYDNSYSKFCAFGGTCGEWVFADHNLRWPDALFPIRSGPHKLVVVVHTLRGAKLRVAKDIQIDAHQAKSYRTTTPPTIDGSLSDWGSASVISLDSITTNTRIGYQPSPANSSATVRSMWTSSYLYFAVSVTDDKIQNDSPDPWRDDEIEIGIDGLHDGVGTGVDDHQYTANPDGRQTDQGIATTAFQVKTHTRIDGWDAEFAIPVSQMKAGALAAGKTLGFNLSLRDDDDGGEQDRQMVWAGTTTYAVEPGWGTFTLVDTAAPTITPTPTGQPAATPTPRGDTITLQTGKNGYNGVQDTFIHKGAPNTNRNEWTSLLLSPDASIPGIPGSLSSLLQFDLSVVPPGAKVFRAILSLRAIQQSSQTKLRADVYPLRRTWAEAEATWNNARSGVPWQVPGAQGANDAGGLTTAGYIWTMNAWYGFDVTQIVRSWVEGSSPNHGLILRANLDRTDIDIVYDFVASNNTDPGVSAYRPELIVSYWSANKVYLPLVLK
jgi:hypothetical protein